jgi:hypothetical protein
MAQLAFELIQIIELEKSGIRDGDSQWSGGCPLSGVIDELRQLDRLDLEEWKATRGRDKVTHGSGAYP